MDDLAERVRTHGSVARAPRSMKIEPWRAEWLWARICARLGAQAA